MNMDEKFSIPNIFTVLHCTFQTSTCVMRAIFHPNQCEYLVRFRCHDTNDATFRSNSLTIRSIKSICCVIEMWVLQLTYIVICVSYLERKENFIPKKNSERKFLHHRDQNLNLQKKKNFFSSHKFHFQIFHFCVTYSSETERKESEETEKCVNERERMKEYKNNNE